MAEHAAEQLIGLRMLNAVCPQIWLQNNKRSEVEIQAIVDGYRQAMSVQTLPAISFRDFALNFQWLMKTMQVSPLTIAAPTEG